MTITCKICGSSCIVKFGHYHGKQRYWCKQCHHKFKDDSAFFHGRTPAEVSGMALTMFYNGERVTDILHYIKQQYNLVCSQQTIYNWVNKYSDLAKDITAGYRINVSNEWIIDETLLMIAGKKLYLIDIFDKKTRYLLTTCKTFNVNEKIISQLLDEATYRAQKSPGLIYRYPVPPWEEQEFTAKHVQAPNGLPPEDRSHKIDRWTVTYTERKRIRFFNYINSAVKFNLNYMIHYNYFLPNPYLNGRTPAEAAGVRYKHKTWSDFIIAYSHNRSKSLRECQPVPDK